MKSKIAFFGFTKAACKLILTLHSLLDQETFTFSSFTTEKYLNFFPFKKINFQNIEENQAIFKENDALIFVGASGIAVRFIAPFLQNKCVDPAVLVLDELGKFVISLLSGHIGGANDLCLHIANKLHAIPVITTATDVNQKFSVDHFAMKNHLHLSSMKLAKEVSSKILEEEVGFFSDLPINGSIGKGLTSAITPLGIYVSYKTTSPFLKTLHLIPKILYVGIGCRKEIEMEKIETLFFSVLEEHHLDIQAIASIASISLKEKELGLLNFAQKYHFPITFYSSKELESVAGDFAASCFVKNITGVDNVCERSAMHGLKKGKIIVYKTIRDGVTIAIAAEDWRGSFE